MTRDPDDIFRALFDAIDALCPVLPSVSLSGEEIMRLAGTATRGAPRLVRAVSSVLDENPDLRAEVPVCPADLRARQERAFAYFTAYGALRRLTEHARAQYLLEQNRAHGDAMLVVHHARHQIASPVPTPRRSRLQMAMLGAEACIAQERGRKVLPRRPKAPRPAARAPRSPNVSR